MIYDEHVPVLVVGGGLAGLTSALFLADHGVPALLVDRYSGASVHGRARGINPRTMELYRPLGLEQQIYTAGKPFEHDIGGVRCETLSDEWVWMFGGEVQDLWTEFSAAQFCLADQNAVEPLLIDGARSRGADLRFNTQLVSFAEDPDGVTAVIEDRESGQRRTVRADYLVGADGHRSMIREQTGITRTGPGVVQHIVSIVFRADLAELIPQRAILWFVGDPAKRMTAFTTTADPGRWALGVGYDPTTESPEDFTPERCVELINGAFGRSDIPVEVEDVMPWQLAIGVADQFSRGRVFLAGDSAHVWPPAGGIGANTGVQDAHNLAWKLAAVVDGWAGRELLDTYHPERHPIAVEFARLTVERQQVRTQGKPGEDRSDDLLWVFGQRYWSSAVLGAEHDSVFGATLDLRAQVGTRAPHLALSRDGVVVSVHDLVGRSFVVLTGAEGGAWRWAAERVAGELSVPLQGFRVGAAGQDVDLVDVDDQWLARYEVGSSGAVLIRPDGYVAWRSRSGAPDSVADPDASGAQSSAADSLSAALRSLLHR